MEWGRGCFRHCPGLVYASKLAQGSVCRSSASVSSVLSCPFTPALHGLSSFCTLGGLYVDCLHPLLRKAHVADWEFYKLAYLRKLVISVPYSGTLLGHFTSE